MSTPWVSCPAVIQRLIGVELLPLGGAAGQAGDQAAGEGVGPLLIHRHAETAEGDRLRHMAVGGEILFFLFPAWPAMGSGGTAIRSPDGKGTAAARGRTFPGKQQARVLLVHLKPAGVFLIQAQHGRRGGTDCGGGGLWLRGDAQGAAGAGGWNAPAWLPMTGTLTAVPSPFVIVMLGDAAALDPFDYRAWAVPADGLERARSVPQAFPQTKKSETRDDASLSGHRQS